MSYENPNILDDRKILSFLQKVYPILNIHLLNSQNCKAFERLVDNFQSEMEDITFWKLLSVDLEKHKVT